ncbi:MAG: hypothetical protein AVDCRST_MAG19-1145 [uncultured Thermomicrobiales bacterium]|uniref:Uncharacterized protein n=1 Tax=uncultured Thermomicrobiales bacterium TaxID=1645740 RepID=A0A6J4UME8_9BACT|nr:MAG: hypothetical protein AVDCRST_MAG19-1145 [uncultured Thermomicrobiales bacterium]
MPRRTAVGRQGTMKAARFAPDHTGSARPSGPSAAPPALSRPRR